MIFNIFKRNKEKSIKQIRKENNIEANKIHEITKRAVYRNFGQWMIEEVGINPLIFGIMNDRIDYKTVKIMESCKFNVKTNPNSRMFYDVIRNLNQEGRK